jgi:hypothetical protein
MSTVSSVPETQVIADIDNYIRQNGGVYSAWYCGIASDPRQRLFVDHNVDQHNGAWIYRDCGTDTAARCAEDCFLRKGCKGDGGGGDWTSRYVYAYKITSTTRE